MYSKQHRCHGESGIPELLYPHTKFPNEYCTPIHDSLVDPVRHVRVGPASVLSMCYLAQREGSRLSAIMSSGI